MQLRLQPRDAQWARGLRLLTEGSESESLSESGCLDRDTEEATEGTGPPAAAQCPKLGVGPWLVHPAGPGDSDRLCKFDLARPRR
jgi:hypothetical protein